MAKEVGTRLGFGEVVFFRVPTERPHRSRPHARTNHSWPPSAAIACRNHLSEWSRTLCWPWRLGEHHGGHTLCCPSPCRQRFDRHRAEGCGGWPVDSKGSDQVASSL